MNKLSDIPFSINLSERPKIMFAVTDTESLGKMSNPDKRKLIYTFRKTDGNNDAFRR